MNAMRACLSQPLSERVGWALVHFLWQGALVAALLGAFLWFTRRRSANLRYVACCGALLLMAACPAATFFLLAGPGAAPPVALPPEPALLAVPAEMSTHPPAELGLAGLTVSEPAKAARPTQLPALPWRQSARDFVEANLSWIVTAWLTGVFVLSARLLFGWRRVRRMVHLGRADACAGCRSTIQALAKRLRVSRLVRVLESALAQTPVVIGWLRPVILLPASVLTGLTLAQLEAVLAHELAHVGRCDYLVNLLQTAAETLLCYHPCGVLGVAQDQGRAGDLLRRLGRGSLRRLAELCPGLDGARRALWQGHTSRSGCHRRLPPGTRPPHRRGGGAEGVHPLSVGRGPVRYRCAHTAGPRAIHGGASVRDGRSPIGTRRGAEGRRGSCAAGGTTF